MNYCIDCKKRIDKRAKRCNKCNKRFYNCWIGKKHSEETKKKIGLKSKGRIHSKETLKKMSLALKGKKRLPFTQEWKRKLSLAHKNKHLSEETKRKMSLAHKGSKCNWWKGGITPKTNKRIATFEWKEQRKKCYKRDKYICQICGIKYCDKNGRGLQAHHMIPYRISHDDSLENLITLCKSCHMKEEWKYYKSLKSEQMELFS